MTASITAGEGALLAAMKAAEMLADGEIASDIATSFNCGEVEILAEFLRACGFDDAASHWIDDHSEGDDCGDEHCLCDECRAGA